jgi:hypothetical protein
LCAELLTFAIQNLSVPCQEHKASWGMILQYIVRDNLLLTGVFFFALVMGTAITGFFLYHVYLLYVGRTTNESFKYSKYW